MPKPSLLRRDVLRIAATVALGARAQAATAPRRAPAKARRPAHFVLVHGAWHGAWCWYRIVTGLEAAGHRATVLDLPGSGIDDTPPVSVGLREQADRVIALLDTIGEPVILVGHSAGGPVVSLAAEARPQAIEKLVYLTAFLIPSGSSIGTIAINDTESVLPQHLVLNANGTISIAPDGRRELFYGDCHDADVTLAQALLSPVGLRPTIDTITVGAAFNSVRRFYITCTRDKAISPAAQQRMYEAQPCEKVISLKSDHSPFLSHPRPLLRALGAIARA